MSKEHIKGMAKSPHPLLVFMEHSCQHKSNNGLSDLPPGFNFSPFLFEHQALTCRDVSSLQEVGADSLQKRPLAQQIQVEDTKAPAAH